MSAESRTKRFRKPGVELSAEKLRRVALHVADWALDAGDTEEERVAALVEVLAALGYDVRTSAAARARIRRPRWFEGERTATRLVAVERAQEPPCGPDRGTARGYRRHIGAYVTPCADCVRARVAELEARWDRLGISSCARENVSYW